MGYHLALSLELQNGRTLEGFVFYSSEDLNLDSLQNTAYLKQLLGRDLEGKALPLTLFRQRLAYTYSLPGEDDGGVDTLFYLMKRTSIPLEKIKSITVREVVEWSVLTGISSELKPSDQSWMKRPPLTSEGYKAYLCSHWVYYHRITRKTKRIRQEIYQKQLEWEEMEINFENGDKLDAELWKMLEKLRRMKVVVISTCTC